MAEPDPRLVLEIAVARRLLSPEIAEQLVDPQAILESDILPPAELARLLEEARAFEDSRAELARRMDQGTVSPKLGRRALQILHEGLRADPVSLDTALSRARTETIPRRLFDRYEVLDEVGRGGMGVVYKVRDTRLDRVVALKVLPGGDHESFARFEREAKVVARLSHPSIVPIFDFGDDGESRYFTMPYVDGMNLHWARKARGADYGFYAEALAQAADALAYAHENGMIHRDVKPSNILLDAAGRAFVADFGLASGPAELTRITVTGTILGTPAYMAPEQARPSLARTLDRRADVYGLGSTLYFCLTGRDPFSGETPFDLVDKVLNAEPARPRDVDPAIPASLEGICLRAMAKDREQRFASADAMAAELRRYLAGQPTSATAPRRKAPPRRVLLAAAAILLLAAAGVFLSDNGPPPPPPSARVAKAIQDAEAPIAQWRAARYVDRPENAVTLRASVAAAAQALRDAMTAEGESATGWSQVGRLHLELGQAAAAQEPLLQAKGQEDEVGLHHWRFARLLEALSEETLRRAMVPMSSDDRRHALDQARRTRAVIASAVRRAMQHGWTPAEPWEGEWARALILFQEGRRPQMRDHCRQKAEELRGQGGEELLLLLGNFAEPPAEPVPSYERAIEIAPAWEAPYLAAARALVYKTERAENPDGMFQDAVRHATGAIEHAGRSAEALLVRGRAREQWGNYTAGHEADPSSRYGEAVEDYTSAISLDARSAEAILRRGVARLRWGLYVREHGGDAETRLGEAVEDLRRAAELDPSLDAATRDLIDQATRHE